MGLMGKRKQIKIDNNIDDKKKLSNRGASGRKVVSYGKDPEGYWNETPKWAFSRADKEMWKIHDDFITIEIDTVIYFQITDPKLYAYGVENPMAAIENLTATTLRNIIGELELDGTLTSREHINSKIRIVLDEATDAWGIKINRVEVKNINPPEDIQTAMEKQMRAERERREAILRAEGSYMKSSTMQSSACAIAIILSIVGFEVIPPNILFIVLSGTPDLADKSLLPSPFSFITFLILLILSAMSLASLMSLLYAICSNFSSKKNAVNGIIVLDKWQKQH